MKRLLIAISLFILQFAPVYAQSAQEAAPRRTPEEVALKQTTMLSRELGIRDSLRLDAIYQVHLRYARLREQGLTRQQNLESLQRLYAELQPLLSAEEFRLFMSHPAHEPRHPQQPYCRMPQSNQDGAGADTLPRP